MATVLVIDDSTFQRSKLVGYLTNAGYETIEAASGRAGLRILEEQTPDIVLLDLLMPELDGFGVLEAMKTNGAQVPIIVLTADIQESRKARCLELGAAAFLNKPPRPEALVSSVREVLTCAYSPTPKHTFSEIQKDALTELINIGVGKAAGVLNEMLETHVELQVPSVSVLDSLQLQKLLETCSSSRHSVVRLRFDGGLTGATSLVLQLSDAGKLVRLLTKHKSDGAEFEAVMESTLLEVGNIVINGVMGSIANTVGMTINYSIPEYKRDTLGNVFDNRGGTVQRYYILADTSFKIEEHKIDGTMFILFEVKSFQSLLESIT